MFTLMNFNLEKGMKQSDMKKFDIDMFMFSVKYEPIYEFHIEGIEGKPKLIALVYDLSLGDGALTYMALLFDDDKLIYWGYPDDFLKSQDDVIRKSGEYFCKYFFED